MGVVVLVVLRSRRPEPLQRAHPALRPAARPGHPAARGRRRGRGASRSRPIPAKPASGIVNKMVANPAPLSAFVVGLFVFAPGVTFLAALQVIATRNASDDSPPWR